jgi:hypothetical protein
MRTRRGIAVGRAGLCAALCLLLLGCPPSQERVRPAIEEVNQEFKTRYEAILAEKGTRIFSVKPAAAFLGTRTAIFGLGMRLESQDPDLGYLSFAAPAPTPLNLEEWKRVAQADLPLMQSIAARHIGLPAYLITFEPEGLEIVINATVLPHASGSEISLTARMRQVKPPPSGMPRREYAPPTGVHMAIDKLWARIEKQLGVSGRRP